MHKQLQETTPDLILAVTEMNDFFLGHLVREIRDGRLGLHPFPVVILLMHDANHDYVKKAVDCGPDDLLLLPVSPALLMSRLAMLRQSRKRFVITWDYVGPERRQQPRPDANSAVCPFEPPNPLAAKTGAGSPEDLQRAIGMAARQLDMLKLERRSCQIQWLSDTIAEIWQRDRKEQSGLLGHIRKLEEMAKDLAKLTESRKNAAPLGENARDLAAAAKALEDARGTATQATLDVLTQATRRLRNAIRDALRDWAPDADHSAS